VPNDGGGTDIVPLYQGVDTVSGVVVVNVNPGKKLEHVGIKVELVGQIGKWGV
jgi:vacuolar protein sorting-associated protein 26